MGFSATLVFALDDLGLHPILRNVRVVLYTHCLLASLLSVCVCVGRLKNGSCTVDLAAPITNHAVTDFAQL